ncbi:MAG: hypothetical protein M3083_19095 [Actinomycetota bacterium]|nr:hypothetical protein [Actinomycetota bacterium]
MDDDEPRTVDVDGMELHLDPAPDANGEIHTGLPPRLESWRRRSVAGAILTGIGLGLKEVLEPKRDEPAVMIETSGTPPSELPVEAELSGILPADNVVKIRPWLLAPGVAPAVAAGTPAVGEVAVGEAPVGEAPVGEAPVGEAVGTPAVVVAAAAEADAGPRPDDAQ